jgi:hypothetical protein
MTVELGHPDHRADTVRPTTEAVTVHRTTTPPTFVRVPNHRAGNARVASN